MQVVERWILARLRQQTFFSLQELNRAIQHLLTALNQRPFKKLPGCRRAQFEALDQPALRPLPAQAYEYAEWRKARVNLDYHIEVERHYYSVPHSLLRREVDVRLSEKTVEIFLAGNRVAVHLRSQRQRSHSTNAEHMPKAHALIWSGLPVAYSTGAYRSARTPATWSSTCSGTSPIRRWVIAVVWVC